MLKLCTLNVILILLDLGITTLLSKKVKDQKYKNLIILISSILTIVVHYSAIAYYGFKDGTAIEYITSNPNLVLPIYPCNIVMWCCLILGLVKNKESKFVSFLIDFIYFFGIPACLVGMFANFDFVNNPTLSNYHVTKGIVAHAAMFLNVMLLRGLGYVKLDFKKNTIHIAISVVMMGIIGLYCTLVIWVLSSYDFAYIVNSMFLLHPPFGDSILLTFPFIGIVGIAVFAGIFYLEKIIIHKAKKN